MQNSTDSTANMGFHQRLQLGALIVLLLSPYLLLSLWGSEAHLIGFFPDDAFYYLKTARNVFEFGFATFDGVNPTNGFHPLYFLLVTALAGMVPATWFLNAAFLLHVTMMGLSIFLLLSRVQTLSPTARIALAAIFSFPAPFLFVWLSAGMEAPLVVLSTVLLLNGWLAASQLNFRSYRANLWLGVTMTVFILSRLDMILALIPFVAWLLVTQFRLARNSASAALMNLSSVLVLPLVSGISYIVFNIVTTGHMLPISAAVKREFFVPFAASWSASTGNGNLALTALAVSPILFSILAIFWSTHSKNKPGARQHVYAIVLAAISVVLFYIYLFTYASNFFRWYFAMPLAAGAWIAVHWLSQRNFRIPMKRGGAVVACMVLALVVLASNALFVRFVASSLKSTSWHLMQIAHKLNEVAQPCDIAAVYDAGVIGYFSNQRVINLDGLANSYTYLNEYLRPSKFLEYLEKEKVSVYLLRDQHARNRSEVASGHYDLAQFSPDSRLKLRRQDELFRYAIPGAFTVIAYRYNNGSNANCASSDPVLRLQ